MMKREDFKALVDLAMTQPGRQAMRPVVEKEILHYDIFAALEKENLLSGLVFQGGTSLRLCWNSNRFSEDLDFAGGRDFDAAKLGAIKSAIEDHIGDRYGLLVEVKEPKESSFVSKWQVAVETSPGERNLPRQRIKIEIANIPAYTEEIRPILQNYDFLMGYGANILVRVETLDEILADKVLAFPASRKHIRYRDIWDIAFLTQRGARLKPDLVVKKMSDYGTESYEVSLQNAIAALPEIIQSKRFLDEMRRFIDGQTLEGTLEKPGFLVYLETTVGDVFKDMQQALKLDPDLDSEPETFRM